MANCTVTWYTPNSHGVHSLQSTNCDSEVLLPFLEGLLDDQFTKYQVDALLEGEYLCYGDGCWVLVNPDIDETIDEAWALEFEDVPLDAWVRVKLT